MKPLEMTIFAIPTETGWSLTDAAGCEMQGGYEYKTKEAALEAASWVWPANSVWRGHRVRNGWRINVDKDG